MKFRPFAERAAIVLSIVLMATGVLAAPPTYQVHVDGLSCPFCAYGIEKKIGALEGVQRLETSVRDGTVVVTMKDGGTLDEAAARQAVKEAGFRLRKFEQVQSAPQGAPAGQAK